MCHVTFYLQFIYFLFTAQIPAPSYIYKWNISRFVGNQLEAAPSKSDERSFSVLDSMRISRWEEDMEMSREANDWGCPSQNIRFLHRSISSVALLKVMELRSKCLVETYAQLSEAYLRDNNPMKAKKFLGLAIKFFSQGSMSSIYEPLKILEAEICYREGSVEEAVELLGSIEYTKLTPEDRVRHHYLFGKLLLEHGENSRGILFFKKADTLITLANMVIPQSPKIYSALMHHYGNFEDYKNQMECSDKLIINSRLINQKFQDFNFNGTYLDGGDTQLSSLVTMVPTGRNQYITYWKIAIALTLFFFPIFNTLEKFVWWQKEEPLRAGYFFKENKIESGLFEEGASDESMRIRTEDRSDPDISGDVVNDILGKLKIFEEDLSFLNFHKLGEVAHHLHTNTSYLSKVINRYKGTSFTNYLNELKIQYAIKRLPLDKHLYGFTIRAISEEYGFSNPEKFSKLFRAKTGKYPSIFLRAHKG